MPIIKSENITEKKSQNFKKIVHETFHKSLKILLEPLISMKNGIEFTIEGRRIRFFPKISVIIADWPEAATFCLTYKSSNSNNPCHFCLVTRDNLAEMNLSENYTISRNHKKMIEIFQKNLTKSVSIENIDNFFWSLS